MDATRQEGHQERPGELISIDSNDLHGRPQGAQGADLPLDTFPAFRPYTPRMKYLPGGPHLPQIRFLNVNSGSKRAEKMTPGSHLNIGNSIKRAKTFQQMEPSLEKDSIDRTHTG